MRSGLLFIFTFYLFISISQGQYFLTSKIEQEEDKSILIESEKKFLRWAEDKDLSKEKGWKWYRRYLEELIQRADFNGTLPDQEEYFDQAIKIAREKEEINIRRAPADWVPIGPSRLPDAPSGSLISGMGRVNTVTFHPTEKNTLWVGVAQGGLWKSTNSGKSWIPMMEGLPIIRISDIAIDPNNTEVMYVCLGDYGYVGIGLETNGGKRNTHYGIGVYKSIDGGFSWNSTGLSYLLEEADGTLMRRLFVNKDNSDHLVTAGISGIWQSYDGGDSWELILDETIMDLEQDQVDPKVLYASSAYLGLLGVGRAAVYKSEDFGNSWEELVTGIPSTDTVQRIEIDIAPSNPNYVYALATGMDGGLYGFYRSIDGGTSWNNMSMSPNILHWGTGTSSGGQGVYDLAIQVDASDPEKIYTGGINTWGTDDGGTTWMRASYWLPTYGPSLHADHHQYNYNPLDSMYYVCHDGGIARTKKIELHHVDELNNSGFQWATEWEDISSGMEITSFYRIGHSPTNTSYMVGGSQDNSTMLLQNEEWTNVVLGDGMECFFNPIDENISYVSSQFGRLYRSGDGGLNYTDNLTNDIINTERGGWTTPFTLHPNNPMVLYAGFGNIWKSENQGFVWKRLSNLPPLKETQFIPSASTMSIAPSDPERIYVGKRIYPTLNEKGKLWVTDTEGRSMTDRTEGLPDTLFFTGSTVSNLNKDLAWVTLGGFAEGVKVFRTDNGGQDWENISINLPNIPVNCIKYHNSTVNNTVYIGTDLGVYYTNDELEEWELYSDNLPNVIVTDLEIDDSNELIYAATFGRGLWMGILNNQLLGDDDIEFLDEDKITLSPNPSNGTFTLTFNDINSRELTIKLIDITGKILDARKIEARRELEEHYNLELLSGLYFLRVSDGKQVKALKLYID